VISSLEHQLKALLPRGRVLTSAAQLAGYGADGLGYKNFLPDSVVIPADAEELAGFMCGARALGVPVVMRGAGTSLSGGPVAVQGGVVVHTSALKCIREINVECFW
jgi:glycolate oxidase